MSTCYLLYTWYAIEWQALEIYCKENVKASSPHLYVCFKSPSDRNDFYQQLLQQKGSVMFRVSCSVILLSECQLRLLPLFMLKGLQSQNRCLTDVKL